MSNKKKKEFMAMYEPVHSRFERFCKARVFGEMDFKDLMQESVLVAFEKFEAMKNKDAFLYFLFGTSIRILSNAKRKMKEDKWNDSFENRDIDQNKAEKQLEIVDLYKALAKLPEFQREAIILYEISGFSVKEIAEIQNAGESAVKQRLARGRQELSELLKDEPVLIN